jgi:DNA-binding CsgD family transcriptional regulator
MAPLAPRFAAEWPLVGRDTELQSIIDARGDSGCRGVVVSAPSGVGKSRLAREAHAAAERDGAPAGWVQATRSAASIPLGAFAGLLPDDVRSDDALDLMRRGAEALHERADRRALVLAVDDAQLLDPVSAALVLHLAVTGRAFVLATVRSGEPCPDAIVSLWKDAGARRIELRRLSDEAVAQLVESALSGPLEQGALRWVIERSQGNALFARELVQGAVAAGTLTRSRGLWRLTGEPTVSRTLIELVADRMTALGDAVREPLELLALGEPLRLSELVSLTGYEAIEAAEAEGLIALRETGGDPLLRVAHPLYGDALRAGLPRMRARLLRLRLAETLQARDPLTPDGALRVARLMLDAGAAIPSRLQLDAARAANLSGDPDLGAQLAELAARDGGGLPATLLLARAHTARKRFAEAEAALAAEEAGLARESAIEYLEQRTHVLFWGLHRPADARALLERAGAWWPDADWQRRLEPLRLGFASVAADASETLETVLADPGLDAATRGMTERRLAVSLFFAGRTKEAAVLAARHRPTIPLRGYGDALALGIRRLIGMEGADNWAALDADMGETLREGVRVNDHEAAGHGALSLGYTAMQRGRFRDAARWLAEAELHFELQDTFGNLLHVRALRVGVEYASGDAEAAMAAHDALLATLDDREALSSQVPYIARANGWAALARGDAAGARRGLVEAADELDGMPGYASQLLYEAQRAGASPATVAERQARLAARCDARLVAAYAAHAAALAARDGTALLEVAEQLAEIGARRYALEAAVDAAEAFLRDGRQDSARRAASRARELHVPGHGPKAPEIDGLDGVAIALTPRESQLIELAAAGLTNAEIADRLVLSVRTVESHIYRAMQKLGVNDRRDLKMQ